jgi:hypothetical protein
MLMGGIKHHRPVSTLDELDALSLSRPLSPAEALRLERAVRRTSKRHEQWHWDMPKIRLLRRLLKRGKRPAQIAVLMGRSERSIWRVMCRLGWAVREPESWVIRVPVEWDPGANWTLKGRRKRNCSIADDGGK